MQPLSTIQLYKSLKKDEFCRIIFKGVFPRDHLPNKIQYSTAFIINTHPSYKRGEHWLAVYYDDKGKCTFFDSFGLHPSFYRLEGFLNKTSNEWEYNKQQLQSVSSMACGYYCIYFILLVCRSFKLKDIIDLFSKKDFDLNDFKISFIYP